MGEILKFSPCRALTILDKFHWFSSGMRFLRLFCFLNRNFIDVIFSCIIYSKTNKPTKAIQIYILISGAFKNNSLWFQPNGQRGEERERSCQNGFWMFIMDYRLMLCSRVTKHSGIWGPHMKSHGSSGIILFCVSAFDETTSEKRSMMHKKKASLSWSVVEEILCIAFLMRVSFLAVSV